MSLTLIAGISLGIILLLVVGLIVFKKKPRKLKTDKFLTSWRELQALCRDKATWGQAILDADQLLDKALKRRRMKGKTMGERLVAAQRLLTDNDDVWFAHNLAKKVAAEASLKIKESDIKDALVAFRQALKDMGALPLNQEGEKKSEAKT